MYSLCTLILLFFMVSLPPSQALASAGYFKSSTMSLNTYGSVATVQQGEEASTSGLSQIFEVSSPTLASIWTMKASSKISKLNDSQLKVSDSKGNQLTLAAENQMTQLMSTSLQFANGAWTTAVSFGQSADSSVFKSRQGTMDLLYNWEERAAVLSLNYSRSELDRPQNYVFDNFFSDSSLKWIARPERLTKERLTASLEQIWTDQYKNHFDFFVQTKNEERPASAGMVLKNYHVIDSRNSVRWDLGTATEDRQEALVDERGYFQMNWTEFQVQHLLTYNLLIGISYGLLQEREDEVRSGRQTQTGSDIYGLKAQYSGRGWLGTLKVEALDSNTSYRTQSLEGVIQWDI